MFINTIFKTIRPSFLVLSPICVFLGLSTALASVPQVNYFIFMLVLIGAISAHISVNMLNEYYDFKSGLDLKTKKTAFSGGSGALPANPELAQIILALGLVSLMVTIIIGIYLIIERGGQIFPIGIVGVLLVITYTQWLNRVPFLCLIAPGLGFGVLMVAGTHVILTGEFSLLAWLVSMVPFFLINNLLLLNQYPDIKADASVGRKTYPVVFGLNKSNTVYAVFALAAYLLTLFIVVKEYIPGLSVIVFIPIVFSLFAFYGALKHESKIGDSPQYLASNVAAAVLTPLLLAISIVTG